MFDCVSYALIRSTNRKHVLSPCCMCTVVRGPVSDCGLLVIKLLNDVVFIEDGEY
jgi:hypothetical protein